MGADLCGYLMCGPEKLKRTNVKRAKDHVRGIAKAAKAVLDALKTGDKLKAMSEADFIKHAMIDGQPEGSPSRTHFTLRVDDNGDEPEDAAKTMADLDADAVVDAFVSMWEDGGERDRMARPCPYKKGHQIVATGERTWGDGPEDDSAWGISEKADQLGLFTILGIL